MRENPQEYWRHENQLAYRQALEKSLAAPVMPAPSAPTAANEVRARRGGNRGAGRGSRCGPAGIRASRPGDGPGGLGRVCRELRRRRARPAPGPAAPVAAPGSATEPARVIESKLQILVCGEGPLVTRDEAQSCPSRALATKPGSRLASERKGPRSRLFTTSSMRFFRSAASRV